MWFFPLGVVALLAFAGYMWWESTKSTGQVSRLIGTETSSTADVHELARAAAEAAGPGSFAHRVELKGVAAAGPGGVLTSEITDTPCLWYRHRVTHHYEESHRDKDGNRRTERKERVISDESSTQAFLLRDRTGEITVVPTARVNGARKVASEFRQDRGRGGQRIELGRFKLTLPTSGDRTLGYEYEEWVLQADTRLFVSGEAFDDRGALEVRGPTGQDALVISTRSEEELIAHHRKQFRNQRVLAIVGIAAAGVLAIVGVAVAFA